MIAFDPEPGHDGDEKARQGDPGGSGPGRDATPAGTTPPRLPRPDVNPGPGQAPGFDPGPGWRAVGHADLVGEPEFLHYGNADGDWFWVLEDPAPLAGASLNREEIRHALITTVRGLRKGDQVMDLAARILLIVEGIDREQFDE